MRAAGCVFAEEEAALLLAHATDTGLGTAGLEALVARRCAGEPLELVVGWAELGGVRVAVAPRVFVPRRRSLVLVDAADALLASTPRGRDGDATVVLDLCCGTGAVGAVLLARRPDLEVHAADVDPDAVACARRNLPADRVHEGDLFGALPRGLAGRVDLVVANAPYVPSDAIATMPPEARDHEALVALDGGPDGLDLHRRIAAEIGPWLAPGGSLVLETSVRQAPRTVEILTRAGMVCRTDHDDEVDGTAVVAHRDALGPA
ncbi:putative protein N(5)-glutamine methyltransferase [Cellulomonas sp. DKR-3]|uniref:Methyltransferase small domain-containing protein n=1 Tax=Cellulomonas fulva TaxID=2835530 RepID=A0ABS5U1E2_9CELL|nr:putative protein N(5)-glutamine methyltransferase [Cellulomonas fulva]